MELIGKSSAPVAVLFGCFQNNNCTEHSSCRSFCGLNHPQFLLFTISDVHRVTQALMCLPKHPETSYFKYRVSPHTPLPPCSKFYKSKGKARVFTDESRGILTTCASITPCLWVTYGHTVKCFICLKTINSDKTGVLPAGMGGPAAPSCHICILLKNLKQMIMPLRS